MACFIIEPKIQLHPMNNIVGSLVESYMYSDMYNREFDGGADVTDKIHVGGVPVENILPSIGKDDNDSDSKEVEQDGGNTHKKCNGPFVNKVVPAGLVLIQIRKDPDVEYEDHVYPGVNREVVPESLYDMLVKSVLIEKRRNRTPPKTIGKKYTNAKKDRSRRMNRK